MEGLKKKFRLKAKQRGRRPFTAYFLGVIFLMFFLLIILEIPPNQTLVYKLIKIPSTLLFFLSLYPTIFFFAYFISTKIHATLTASIVCFYLLIRYAGLTHPIFFIIILGLYVTLSLFFYKRK
jgi:hypothetical protein